jgi:demethylmenaquinone methyltransferase / 2-methoxy-6-polyprenyl-1,4-benzoquinol methylase
VVKTRKKSKTRRAITFAEPAENKTIAISNPLKDPDSIRKMFGRIAGRYDLGNAILCFNLYRLWNKRLAKSLQNSQVLLDLCSGTGEIAFRWLDLQKAPKTAILLDFCEEMLKEACAKSVPYQKNHTLKIIRADATAVPLEAGSVDGVSIAYGIRNVQATQKCFQEVFRVLQPLGKFAILELTQPSNFILNKLHQGYLNYILPTLGGLVSQDKEAYTYLSKSVQGFSKPEVIKAQLLSIGFIDVVIHPLTFGVATLIEARVPGMR